MIRKLTVLFILGSAWAGLFQKNVVKFLDLSNCIDYNPDDLKITIENVSLTTDNTRRTVIDCYFKIKEDIHAKLEEELKITKCGNNDSPDSCVDFHTMKIPNMCKFLSAKNVPWSDIMSNTEPKMTCPLKKGVYRIINGFIETENLPFPFDPNYRWKVQARNLDSKTKAVLSCCSVTLQIVKKKDK